MLGLGEKMILVIGTVAAIVRVLAPSRFIGKAFSPIIRHDLVSTGKLDTEVLGHEPLPLQTLGSRFHKVVLIGTNYLCVDCKR